ncbi:hypothetical protein ACUN7V_00025 [Quadrisphaera oryzae]|uniref:hypothetical protein n=1 Tax=Quadrisphaera TaxID=317661 RepID=UPI00164639A6|nr:hypothetical protein [Quadrisphaera sp. RL12-1S]MBC3762962.1 hypothetical protein [Quadrisphaera sp. RL12-1S]
MDAPSRGPEAPSRRRWPARRGGRRGRSGAADGRLQLRRGQGWALALTAAAVLGLAALVGGTAVVVHHRAVRSRATEPDLAGG